MVVTGFFVLCSASPAAFPVKMLCVSDRLLTIMLSGDISVDARQP